MMTRSTCAPSAVIRWAIKSWVSGRSLIVPRMNMVIALPDALIDIDDEHFVGVAEENRTATARWQDRAHLHFNDRFVHLKKPYQSAFEKQAGRSRA